MLLITFLLLKNGLYPYVYTGEWEKFTETTLLEKEGFHNNFNMEDNTDTYYIQSL